MFFFFCILRLSFTTPILEVPWTDKEAEANAAALDAILQAYKVHTQLAFYETQAIALISLFFLLYLAST